VYWYAPAIAELDPDGESWELLLRLLECEMPLSASAPRSVIEEGKRFLAKNRPRTAYREYRIGESIKDLTTEIAPRRLEIYGSIMFTKDVTKLFRELNCINKRLALGVASNEGS
jgi:hypothetical protein